MTAKAVRTKSSLDGSIPARTYLGPQTCRGAALDRVRLEFRVCSNPFYTQTLRVRGCALDPPDSLSHGPGQGQLEIGAATRLQKWCVSLLCKPKYLALALGRGLFKAVNGGGFKVIGYARFASSKRVGYFSYPEMLQLVRTLNLFERMQMAVMSKSSGPSRSRF